MENILLNYRYKFFIFKKNIILLIIINNIFKFIINIMKIILLLLFHFHLNIL